MGQIKEGDYMDTLLHFLFEYLGHSVGKPIDAANFDVTTYSFDIEDDPAKDSQWLMIHLYYLCLQRMPALAKSWWINNRSRQLRTAVESWTEKHVSLTGLSLKHRIPDNDVTRSRRIL